MSPPRTVLFLGAPPRLSPRENLRVLHRARLQSDTIPIGVGVVLIDVERDPRGALVEAARNWRDAPRILVLPPGHPYRADLVGLCDAQVHPPATDERWRALVERSLGNLGLSTPPRSMDVPLPALSDSVRELILLLESPDTSIAEAATALEQDPALAANVLALANSAYYGVPRGVANLQEAAVQLGLRTLRLAVITAYVFDTLQPRARALRERAQRRLKIARRLGAISDEAATAALLLDVGTLLLLEQHTAHAQRTSTLGPEACQRADTARFGTDRDLIGAELLARWRLPSSVVRGVAHGRTSFPDPSDGLVPEVVCWVTEKVLQWQEGGPPPDTAWVRSIGLQRPVAALRPAPPHRRR